MPKNFLKPLVSLLPSPMHEWSPLYHIPWLPPLSSSSSTGMDRARSSTNKGSSPSCQQSNSTSHHIKSPSDHDSISESPKPSSPSHSSNPLRRAEIFPTIYSLPFDATFSVISSLNVSNLLHSMFYTTLHPFIQVLLVTENFPLEKPKIRNELIKPPITSKLSL